MSISATERRRLIVRRRYNKKAEEMSWIVVSDPVEDIAFIEGMILSNSEKCCMLTYGTFNPGTILRCKKKKYIVVGDVGTKQHLIALLD